MNAEQTEIALGLISPLEWARMPRDFESERQQLASRLRGSGYHGRAWWEIRKPGLCASEDMHDWTVIVRWSEIRTWVDTWPQDVIHEGQALIDEWSRICRDLMRPLSFRPREELEEWERNTKAEYDAAYHAHHLACMAFRDRLRALAAEPTDLLELLEVDQ